MRTDTSIIGTPINAPLGTNVMHFGIVDMPLLDGSFTFALGIQSRSGILYDWRENAGSFEVMNPGKTTGSIHMKVHAAVIDSESRLDTPARAAGRWPSPAERGSQRTTPRWRCPRIRRPTSRG